MMIDLKRIAIALILFFAVLELILPNEAYAFGKKPQQKATQSNAQKKTNTPIPVVVVNPPVKVEAKPTSFRPAQPVLQVIKPVAVPVVTAPKQFKAKKQSKFKAEPINPLQATKALKAVEEPVTVVSETSQSNTGQRFGKHVDNGLDSVSGLFGKLKNSMNQPATQNFCSTAQKAMNQC